MRTGTLFRAKENAGEKTPRRLCHAHSIRPGPRPVNPRPAFLAQTAVLHKPNRPPLCKMRKCGRFADVGGGVRANRREVCCPAISNDTAQPPALQTPKNGYAFVPARCIMGAAHNRCFTKGDGHARKNLSHALRGHPLLVSQEHGPDGVTLVFLPGLTADHRLFDKQVAFFEGKYNLLVWDAPGHGASWPFRLEFSLMDKARWLDGILCAENLRCPVIIGQSMGGYVGQAYAELFPGKLKGFVSIDSAPLQRKYVTASNCGSSNGWNRSTAITRGNPC